MEMKQAKSADILYAFLFSLVYVVIDAAVLLLLVEPLHLWLPIEPVWLETAVHILIISLIGTALGCMSFWAVKDRPRLVPMGYAFFPVYLALCYLYPLFKVPEPVQRETLIRLISMYGIAPVLVGISLSVLLYKRKQKADSAEQ